MASTGCCCGCGAAAVDGADAPGDGFGPAAAASSGFPPLMVGLQVVVLSMPWFAYRSRAREVVVGRVSASIGGVRSVDCR